MENLVIQNPGVVNNQKNKAVIDLRERSIQVEKENTFFNDLASEDCGNFVNYIESVGLNNNPDIVILSSKHHFFFDAEDMRNVRTIVNLKKLNNIKQIQDFLYSVCSVLPQKCNFVGCFLDNAQHNHIILNHYFSDSEIKEKGIAGRKPFINGIYYILDSRQIKYLTKKKVRHMLEVYGFSIIDMTDLNSLTYFYAQKV